MKLTRLNVVGLGLFLALLLLPDALPQDSVIRVNVRLVRLLVTVRTAAGGLVTNLQKKDFNVFDNGAKQEIAVFERHTEQPLSISVLIDTSASTGKDLQYETDSVLRFVRAVVREGNPDDAVSLYAFNWQVRQVVDFTRQLDRMARPLKALRAEGGTSMYDAIYLASQDLEPREGRHVLIIVTDGGDTTSYKNFNIALRSAQRADTVIYPILDVPITNPAGRNIGGEHALTTMANGTGGAVFRPEDSADLDTAFDDILTALRTQYLVGFYPHDVPLTKNPFHEIRVTVGAPNLRVITRNGYYGESSETSH
ncbi:MAG TPA: VWA domain-containing protein [Bryobacteraceae bacterium]|nr:VWA domain-containing protein [Bryobacteraceae bacterium]